MSFLPCLLERWERWQHSAAAADEPMVLRSTWDDVRRDVVRNLEWLLNTEARTWRSRPGSWLGESTDPLPEAVADSVVGFGIAPYSGRPQSNISLMELASELEHAIQAFEPRIHRDSLYVEPEGSGRPGFNALRFVVRGQLRANPMIEFEVRTEFDLESGQARVLS